MAEEYEVYWAEVAEEDLKIIVEYIYKDDPLAVKRGLRKIMKRTSELHLFPERGRVVPELREFGILQYREIIVSPWRIIYRILETQVHVLSVIDSRRNIEDVLLDRLVRSK